MSQLLEHVVEADSLPIENLPILATANDVREVVQFLKKRPAGICISDIPQPIKKRVFFHTKVAAYEFWGIVSKNGEHLKLSPLGWQFAESLEPEAQSYRKLLARTAPYRSFLEELSRQHVDVITHEDVARYWLEHYPEAVLLREDGVAAGPAVCFFHLCQAAELGTMTIGKRGQPARLRILRDELRAYLEQSCLRDDDLTSSNLTALHVFRSRQRPRVYISTPNEAFANQISEILGLNDIDSEVLPTSSSKESEIVSREALTALMRCQAAIFIVANGEVDL